jgi:hypothetical protein
MVGYIIDMKNDTATKALVPAAPPSTTATKQSKQLQHAYTSISFTPVSFARDPPHPLLAAQRNRPTEAKRPKTMQTKEANK